MLQDDVLQARFARSPAVNPSLLALAASSRVPLLREYALDQIRADPSLLFQCYKSLRTLLHDACSAGDLDLVQQLIWALPRRRNSDVIVVLLTLELISKRAIVRERRHCAAGLARISHKD
jgi:hypothetical protein